MNRLKTSLLTSVLVVTLAALLLRTSAAEAAAIPSCGTWSVISSPNIVETSQNDLYGVTAISTNNVWTVGYYVSNIGPDPLQTLIEHWDGTQWSIVPSPNVGTGNSLLQGVTAISSNNVWAVGYGSSDGPPQTLTEHWDGTSWSIVPSPNVVGSGDDALTGVIRVPGSNQLWAVGYYVDGTTRYDQTLIEHWDGAMWNIVSSPNAGMNDSVLNGVTAVSASNAWAVGNYGNTLPTAQTLIEHWNGTNWSIATPESNGSLNAVTRVPGSNKPWSVGLYGNTNGILQTLTERQKGMNWHVVSSPNVGTGNNALEGVTAVSANSVWAAGFSGNIGSISQTLIEYWNGTIWSVVSSPTIGTGTNAFFGVTRVPSSNQLWAVGYYYNIDAASNQTLIEFYC